MHQNIWGQQQQQYGGFSPNQMQNTLNDPRAIREQQIAEVKKSYQGASHQRHTNLASPIDVIELTISAKGIQIPITLLLDESYPVSHPRILIRGRLKHRMFEDGPNGIEIQVSSFMSWSSSNNLVQALQALKSYFEKDPPQQEKIIGDVDNLLSSVTEQDFKDLVTTDVSTLFQAKTTQELRDYAQAVSYQEIIASSKGYQKIAKNLLEVAAFNEKTAREIMDKVEQINQRKKRAAELVQKIDQAKQEYAYTQSKCKNVSDRFNLQEVYRAVEEEHYKLDKLSNEIDETASMGRTVNKAGNLEDMIQLYYETRKKFHYFDIIKTKLPGINPN
eukprot:CAMPEP_0176411918 /NCGR_PEP_ID=MMETSP0127-20121128/3861_1 /TAXON_ID=938130 /ORGANISM="Platyophrya macrostoma, Strain WH" /LENGTH=331 /DNA_ID=CAMNT_0017791543 /DNA_START=109 /DNA_END=1104 /DNA_ORIENTATION=+